MAGTRSLRGYSQSTDHKARIKYLKPKEKKLVKKAFENILGFLTKILSVVYHEFFEMDNAKYVVKKITSISVAAFIYVMFLKSVFTLFAVAGAYSWPIVNSIILGLTIAIPLVPAIFFYFLIESKFKALEHEDDVEDDTDFYGA
ncbi:hypothetical protein Ab1vBOLIVR6_gp29c [Agrobacterium phage OLIVR6]|nr:hypothetical protein Ab1vBOLIVR6_gp29c [Agrobacterium phage OLIVR6]